MPRNRDTPYTIAILRTRNVPELCMKWLLRAEGDWCTLIGRVVRGCAADVPAGLNAPFDTVGSTSILMFFPTFKTLHVCSRRHSGTGTAFERL